MILNATKYRHKFGVFDIWDETTGKPGGSSFSARRVFTAV